ncbi:MAG TPA: hypothetical protein VMR14_10665 [Streptosporangiaceae bacterium]|jgi:hypothetical protein|nr:hypothetical protein [Streptosporangiaceae bacterium]
MMRPDRIRNGFADRLLTGGTMRCGWRTVRRAVLAAAAGLSLAAPLAAATPAAATSAAPNSVTVTSHFVWTPPDRDFGTFWALIVNGATDNRPTAVLFMTQNYNANAECGCVYDKDPIGVFWNGTGWELLNEDQDPILDGSSFNILVVPKASKYAFSLTAKPSNISGDSVFINSKLTNGKPGAEIQVTQNLSVVKRNTQMPVYNPHQVGVRYDRANKRWAIFNEDHAAMPVNVSFNVLVSPAASNGGHGEELTATTSNLRNGGVAISTSQTTGNPNNVTFVTQNSSPGGETGHLDNAQPGVWYNGNTEVIFNEDQSDIAAKTAFNVLTFSS